MGIYKKLLELQKELTVMPKQKEGGSTKNPYKYTSGDYLFSVLRPKMDALGLLLFQEIIETHSEHVLWKTSYGDKQQTYSSATFKFTWVDADTAEKLEHIFHADGFNDWDKAIGSAMTYAERYYILKQFHIPTTELDPDARKEPTEAEKLFADAKAKGLTPDWEAIKTSYAVKNSSELTKVQLANIRKDLGL